jgi:hypothetical protein
LYQELTSTEGIPSKPAFTPCVDETGDDYGLGAGVCEEAPDDPMVKGADVDIEGTLQELAQNACVGMERTGDVPMDMILKTLQTAMRRFMET